MKELKTIKCSKCGAKYAILEKIDDYRILARCSKCNHADVIEVSQKKEIEWEKF